MFSSFMDQFAKKITPVLYIYLLLSAPEINAARVKQEYDAYNAARANTLDARHHSGQSQELLQETDEAMQDIEQINSEQSSSYWGESWATCDDHLEDFQRRQKKLEARYDNSMKDGVMSAMETGRVSLKAFSVASTLSKASKKGCEWVTNKSVNSSSMNRILAETMKKNKCFGAAVEFLEKARAAGESPDEAKVNAQKIMLSMDCKMPNEDSALPAQKSFQELASMEEAAEAGALGEIQELKKTLGAGKNKNQTSLVETNSGFGPVLWFLLTLLYYIFTYFLECTVVYSVLAILLTTVFLAIKAGVKVALGYSSGVDFKAEMAQILKPSLTIIATGCAAYSIADWASFFAGTPITFVSPYWRHFFHGGSHNIALWKAKMVPLAKWVGVTGVYGSTYVGGKSLATQAGLIGPDAADVTKTEEVTKTDAADVTKTDAADVTKTEEVTKTDVADATKTDVADVTKTEPADDLKELHVFLEEAGLKGKTQALINDGWDSVALLKDATDQDLRNAGLGGGHIHKLKKALRKDVR